jgi:hypothetical protein
VSFDFFALLQIFISIKTQLIIPTNFRHIMSSEQSAENLYHILLSISHVGRDPEAESEKNLVCGTYTLLPAAKAAAHRCLRDAGYEEEWFTELITREDEFPPAAKRTGLMVYAKSQDQTTFSVCVLTTQNPWGYEGNEEGKVVLDLYHVVQTTIFYDLDESGQRRDTMIEGSFESFQEARNLAKTTLLNEEDGITKESYEEYDEAGDSETDFGYGEDVIVHAVGGNGENFLVRVLKGGEPKLVR